MNVAHKLDLDQNVNDRQSEFEDGAAFESGLKARDADIIRCLKEMCNGNYSADPTGSDELSNSVRQLVTKFRTSATDRLARTVSLSVLSGETAIQSANMLSNLRTVDGNAQSIAAAAEQMAATVQEIGNYGENIAQKTEQVRQVTELGAEAAKEAVEGMNQIAISVEQSVTKVDTLTELSERIANISHNIKKVANHTNLLAINAAIEAARAGEAGKGFAVVAEEVKSLSNQTRSATEEVSAVVEQLQLETKEILDAMQASKNAVEGGQSAIKNVGTRMGEIQTSIVDVTENTAQISDALSEQRKASQDVAQGITHIADNSSKSVEGIENVVGAMSVQEKLISEQIAELADLELPNKVIKLAQSDHVLWVKRLANMVVGREGLNANELADHHSCRLGKWYDKVTEPKLLNHPAFAQLAAPHQIVHDHGIRAARHYNNRDLPAALEEIAMVEQASKQVLALLVELENA